MLRTFTAALAAAAAFTLGAGVASADTDTTCSGAQAELINATTAEQTASAAVATAAANRAAATDPFVIIVDDARVRYADYVEARAARRVTRAQAAVDAVCEPGPAVVTAPPPLISADLGLRLGAGANYGSSWR